MAAGSRDIAHFKNAELIGRGGFGSVFRATDSTHGREVAIKVLQGSMGETERRRFDRERKTMGHLGNHPNIVAVFDSGYTEEGEGYIVMELATGGTLQEKLDAEGLISWQEAASTMAAVANAVQMAHENGVIHRDIKPDNILIDQFGTAKLSDFGIAAVANNATATTSTTMTLAHAAPEVLQGQPSTEAVDIYAIGSTFYNLVTGLPPFMRAEDETVTPMLTRALTEPPPDLRPRGVPDWLALVVEQSLSKDPAARQTTGTQLAEGLSGRSNQPATTVVPRPEPVQAAPPEPEVSFPAGPSDDNATVVAPQPIGAHMGPSPGETGPGRQEIFGAASPSTRASNTSNSRAIWALVAVVLIGVAVLGALILSQGNSTSPDVAAGPTVTESTSTTSQQPDSTEPEVATTQIETTEVETTTSVTITERMLNGSATASSSAQSGVDACGDTTTFDAANLVDGQPTTAWRVSGNGAGAWIEIALGSTYQITSVGLVPGYAKIDACDDANRFSENRRVIEVRWIIGSQSFTQILNPDSPEMQSLPITQPISTDRVRLEIVATTAPGGRDFTAISEIAILGG